VRRPEDLFGRFARSPKPYVGRIAGHCVAGGMGLAAAMDVSIAADDAKFGFTEVRVGVAPAVISVVCLPKLRPADARAAFLRGTRFPAAEAARIGLINRVVADVEREAAEWAVHMGAKSGAVLALARRAARLGAHGTRAEALAEVEAIYRRDLLATHDAAEGVSAFLEKRRPRWRDG
jgi:methylglutaconyl-CoA hydratase